MKTEVGGHKPVYPGGDQLPEKVSLSMLRSWKGGLRAVAMLALVAGGGCNRTPDSPDLTGDGGEDTGGDDDATSSAPTSTTEGADGSSGTDGTDAPKYDVGGIPDAPTFPSNCEGGEGNGGGSGGPQFSYIWVANSSEGTVSKIDTVTLEEVGRYKTHPSYGDPSRTSVSLNGDVAVANRNGGLVKFWANPANCVDRNGNGSIDTSTGKNDVLAWDDEECRAWYTPFDYESQRPVAWTPGQWSSSQCRYVDTKVWTSGTNGGFGGGMGGGKPFPGEDGGEEPPPPGGGEGGGNGVDVILVDGETGEVEHAVKIPEVIPDYFGLYGGAVDGDGNFFGTQLGYGHVVRVNLSDLEYTVWPQTNGGYGMTVDQEGRVWTCDYTTARFDPDTAQWDTVNLGGGGGSGCMVDAEGVLWVGGDMLTGVDTESLDIVATHNIVGGGGWTYLKGISIDFQGYVWAVTMDTEAYRVDPDSGEYETYSGLNGPYTYSDMTGFALANSGGWTPAG